MTELNGIEQNLIKVPLPKKTSSYTPIGHANFIFPLHKEIQEKGLSIIHKSFSTGNNGNQLIGLYTLDLGDDEINLTIGFKNSYDKSMKASVIVAARCTRDYPAELIIGESVFNRKHMGNADLELNSFITKCVTYAKDNFPKIQKTVDILNSLPIDMDKIYFLAGKIFIKGPLTSVQRNIFKTYVDNYIDYCEHYKQEYNLWGLYKCALAGLTAAKHPTNIIGQHKKLLNVFQTASLMYDIWKELELDPMYADEFELIDDTENTEENESTDRGDIPSQDQED